MHVLDFDWFEYAGQWAQKLGYVSLLFRRSAEFNRGGHLEAFFYRDAQGPRIGDNWPALWQITKDPHLRRYFHQGAGHGGAGVHHVQLMFHDRLLWETTTKDLKVFWCQEMDPDRYLGDPYFVGRSGV